MKTLAQVIESLLRSIERAGLPPIEIKTQILAGDGVAFGALPEIISGDPPVTMNTGIFVVPTSDDAPSGWGPVGLDPWVVGGTPNGVIISPNVIEATDTLVDYTIKTGQEIHGSFPVGFDDWTRPGWDGYLSWKSSGDRYGGGGSSGWVNYNGTLMVRFVGPLFYIIYGACLSPDETKLWVVTVVTNASDEIEYSGWERDFNPLDVGIVTGVYDAITNPDGFKPLGTVVVPFTLHANAPAGAFLVSQASGSVHFNAAATEAVCMRQVFVGISGSTVKTAMAGYIRFTISSSSFALLDMDVRHSYLEHRIHNSTVTRVEDFGSYFSAFGLLDAFDHRAISSTTLSPMQDIIVAADYKGNDLVTANYTYSSASSQDLHHSGTAVLVAAEHFLDAVIDDTVTGTTTHTLTLPTGIIVLVETDTTNRDSVLVHHSLDDSIVWNNNGLSSINSTDLFKELTYLDLRYDVASFTDQSKVRIQSTTKTNDFINESDNNVRTYTTKATDPGETLIFSDTNNATFTDAFQIPNDPDTFPVQILDYLDYYLDSQLYIPGVIAVDEYNLVTQNGRVIGTNEVLTPHWDDPFVTDKYGGMFLVYYDTSYTFAPFTGEPTRVTESYHLPYFTPAGLAVANYLSVTGLNQLYSKLSLW